MTLPIYIEMKRICSEPLENEKPDKTATKEERVLCNEHKKLVTRGYKQIQERIKDLRHGFSQAVVMANLYTNTMID